MTVYIKKAQNVTAVQWFPGVEHPAIKREFPCYCRGCDTNTSHATTTNRLAVCSGDWIITLLEENNEITVVADEKFQRDYRLPDQEPRQKDYT